MKLQPVNHPVVGPLAPDQWGESLMGFREIPGMKLFVPVQAKEALERLDGPDRQLVESWKEVPRALIKKCREFDMFDGLRSLGVFEVGFSRTPTGTLSDEQVAAWKYFLEHESRISATIANALLRYYPVARAADEQWFDNNDCPAVKTLEELGPLATLDGINFTNQVCEGLAVLTLGWKVNWDEEHGLPMFVWKDQVIGIGVEDLMELTDPVAAEYAIWNRSHRTEIEQDYLERVTLNLGARKDEDFEDEYADDFDEDEDE